MKIKRVVAALLLVVFGGCASIFTGKTNKITVNSATPGAQVTVDGAPYGQTPMELQLDKTRGHTIVISRGEQNLVCTVSTSVGAGWVILDILLGLLPVIVDAATGKWKSLDGNTCYAPF